MAQLRPNGSRARRVVWRRVLKILFVAGGLLMFFRWFERVQTYHPTSDWVCRGDALGWAWEDVSWETEDGVRLSGWYFPGSGEGVGRGRAVLIAHGNGGNVSHRMELCGLYRELGCDVLVFDYRGYGRSGGRPGEEGTYRDAVSALRWLEEERGAVPGSVVAHGESLGGAVVVELALRRPVAGLVLQSTFTSLPDIGAELFPWLPVRFLASIRYDTRSKLGRLRVPVLILHSREDRLVGFHHAERNRAAAGGSVRLWEIEGGHNEQPRVGRGRFRQGLAEFLANLAPTAGAGGSTP